MPSPHISSVGAEDTEIEHEEVHGEEGTVHLSELHNDDCALITTVRFKSELANFAAPNAKSEALPRLASALTDARSALQLDRSGGDTGGAALASRFKTMDDIQSYLSAIHEYLSLVKGFTVAPAVLLSEAQPPLTDGTAAVNNPVATVAASNGSATPRAGLIEPLIDKQTTQGVSVPTSRSKCLSFCSWHDVLSNTNSYAPNARIEQAQALLASGLAIMNASRATVDTMLAERVTEINENQLKIGYQLLLHAAGVLEACVHALDHSPQSIGAAASDLSTTAAQLSTPTSLSNANPTGDDALEKWREEQRRASQPPPVAPTGPCPLAPAPSSSSSDDFALLNRIGDLANARFPQVLAWVALAQAQELVILRGISRGFVDYALMAKLAIDVAQRYKETHAFTARHLPCGTSSLANRLRLYCTFKDAYYTAVSCYFQGAACMEKQDGRHCAMAIADLKKATPLIQEASRRKAEFDAKADKSERDRQFMIKTVYVRAEQIIQRDLEICTRRNDSIYYERIPDPEPQCEPLSLVRAMEFPAVDFHPFWHDPDILNCLQPPRARANNNGAGASHAVATTGNTQESSPRRDGCCASCVIS